MPSEVTLILRNSLLETDRIKRRQWIAFAVLFLALLAILLWIGHLAGQTTTDLRSLVLWSVIAMIVAVCYGAMALAIYISRTTPACSAPWNTSHGTSPHHIQPPSELRSFACTLECGGLFTLLALSLEGSFEGPPLSRRKQLRESVFLLGL